MRKLINIALFALLPALAACSGDNKEDSKVTQTRMDDIDSIEGTINDDMIDTTDQATTDTAPDDAEEKTAEDKEKPETIETGAE